MRAFIIRDEVIGGVWKGWMLLLLEEKENLEFEEYFKKIMFEF